MCAKISSLILTILIGIFHLQPVLGASFTGLGYLSSDAVWSQAFGVSPDGSTVVGMSEGDTGGAFRWTKKDGMIPLGYISAYGAHASSIAYSSSANGSFIVGRSTSPSGSEAFLWEEDRGMTGLGDLPGGLGGLDFFSEALAISADGSAIVGRSMSDSGSSHSCGQRI